MVIKHNLSAMNAQRQYNIIGNRTANHIEKLSSGYKVNRAADDAAGLSISEKMRRQIRGLSQGIANTQDGVSLCQVADGALNEVIDMVHRLEVLSVKAATGTNSTSDREAIQLEVDHLLEEIDRISDTTTFNERRLFSGELATGGSSASTTKPTQPGGTDPTQPDPTQPPPNLGTVTWLRGAGNGGLGVSGGVSGTDYVWNSATGVLTIMTSKEMLIQNQDPSAATSDRIVVKKEVSANILLANVNINVSGSNAAAFEIERNSTKDVNVTLYWVSSLQSGSGSAGLQKSNHSSTSGWLTIGGPGELTAQGGAGGAGIGCNNVESGRQIKITGGRVIAKGGVNAAGIGGGVNVAGVDIEITGGIVEAYGNTGGAGIGGGDGAPGNMIQIKGGTVTAKGGGNAAGIGGGSGTNGAGTNITISNSIVKASGGNNAQSIGNGKDSTASDSNSTIGGKQYTSAKDGSTSVIVAGAGGALILDNAAGVNTNQFKLDGNNATLNQDFEVSNGMTMTVKDGFTLTVKKDTDGDPAILTNDGKIVNDGTIKVYGEDPGAYVQTARGVLQGKNPKIDIQSVDSPDKPSGGTGSGKFAGNLWIQSGYEVGDGMYLQISAMNVDVLGLTGLNVTTERNALKAIDALEGALTYVSDLRSLIGAQQNRLEHTIANEGNILENTTASESSIRDADMAQEMVAFTLTKNLGKVGESVSAQANASGRGVLKLLK